MVQITLFRAHLIFIVGIAGRTQLNKSINSLTINWFLIILLGLAILGFMIYNIEILIEEIAGQIN